MSALPELARPNEIEIDFDFSGESLLVDCEYYPAFRGNREEPGNAEGYVPTSVIWRGIDITKVLSLQEMDQIEAKVNDE